MKTLKEFTKFKPKNVPIYELECILIKDGKMTFGDLESIIVAPTNIKGEGLVSFADVQKVLIKYPDANIQMNESFLFITEKNKEFKIPVSEIDNYPKLPQIGNKLFTLNVDKEFLTLEKFLGRDELRPAMTGVFVGKTQCAATNAHYLKWLNRTGGEKDIIFPKNIFKVEQGEYEVYDSVDHRHIHLVGKNYSYIFAPIDAKYPDINVVIPENPPIEFTVDKDEFKTLIEDTLLMANKTTCQVYLNTQTMSVSGEDIDMSTSYEGKFKLVEHKGDNLDISFNGKMMLDLIKSIDDIKIKLGLTAPSKAILVNDNALIMPVMGKR